MKETIEQLFTCMATLVRLHEQMIATLDQQLAAARAADTETMRQCQQRCEDLARQVVQAEVQRRDVSRQLAARANVAPAAGERGLTVSRLAMALPPALRGRLLAEAAALRERIQETGRLNRLLADVSRRILLHLSSAYQAVAQTAGTTGVYAANGQLRREARSTVFEVVG